MVCHATNPKRGPPSKGEDSTPQQKAIERRDEQAEQVEGAINDAGDQLASALASGVVQAETVLGRAQGQAAKAASSLEDQAAGTARQASTNTGTGAASDTALAAGDFASDTAAASADTLAGRQKDAEATEKAVKEQVGKVAGAVSDGLSSIPTPAAVIQNAADGAADLLRGVSQASGQVSSSAADFQRNADELASEVQRSAREQAQQLQEQVNEVAEKANAAARDLREGTTYRRGRALLSDTAHLTSMSASAGGKNGKEAVPYLKTRLLAHVAGLDRGFAANKRQTEAVEAAVRDLVVAAGPVDLLSSAAAADSSIYAVTKKSDSSPTSAGTPAGPSTAVASGSPPSASGQTVTVGNKGVTYVAGPVPEIKSISPVPQTPGFATPGSSAGGPAATGAPGGASPSDAGLAASRSEGSSTTPVGAPINQPMPVNQPGKPPVTDFSSSSPTTTTSGEAPTAIPVSETKRALSAPGEGDGIAGTGASTGQSQGDKLGGLWRLVYSSGFARRNTGGARPGVPLSLFPAQFGQVYQGIDLTLNRLDNVVELRRPALPVPSFVPVKALPAEALLTLKHSVAVTGPATVQITFVGTDVNLQGGLGGLLNSVPQFSLPGTDDLPPQLQPPKRSRSATFEVLFLDDDIRVTRGDRNEIRVFLRT